MSDSNRNSRATARNLSSTQNRFRIVARNLIPSHFLNLYSTKYGYYEIKTFAYRERVRRRDSMTGPREGKLLLRKTRKHVRRSFKGTPVSIRTFFRFKRIEFHRVEDFFFFTAVKSSLTAFSYHPIT